ncbi:hypothetical protein LOD99_8568 [Oopsacas minuta]|uniref:HTH CENPB-type domain-containing protein n=1 Tax=Oopsacas minuta TaxID=111878 RepID=A0AAV7JFZ8_9METZ|nr:hypothetical protein LOD99_8568 [Oopsacas minuta]
MSGKSKCKRLNESQRFHVLARVSEPTPPSKRSLAREYEVSEGAIRKLCENRGVIRKRFALLSGETKQKNFEVLFVGFTDLEDMLYLWIDDMRRANLPVPPSLAIAKAKQTAEQLSISEDDFKTSWQ